MRATFLAAILLLLAGTGARAWQPPLPAAMYSQTAIGDECSGFEDEVCGDAVGITKSLATYGAVTASDSGASGNGAGWSSIRPGLHPKLATRAVGNAAGGGIGSAQITYYIQVIGPAGVQVPVILTVTGALHGTKVDTNSINSFNDAPESTASAGIYPNGGSATQAEFSCIGSLSAHVSSGCGPFSRTIPVAVQASTQTNPAAPTSIALSTSSSADPLQFGTTTIAASSFITVSVAIDPSFANPNDEYKIRFGDWGPPP